MAFVIIASPILQAANALTALTSSLILHHRPIFPCGSFKSFSQSYSIVYSPGRKDNRVIAIVRVFVYSAWRRVSKMDVSFIEIFSHTQDVLTCTSCVICFLRCFGHRQINRDTDVQTGTWRHGWTAKVITKRL